MSTGQLFLYGALFSIFLILLRLFWTFPGAYVAHLITTHLLRQNERPLGARYIFIVGWTGMRGVIALAAAMSLPQTVADGSPFPHRDLIVFLTFAVILVTLLFQGPTLSPLIRVLGLGGSSGAQFEARDARRLVLQATLQRLDEIRRMNRSDSDELYDDFERHYRHRLATVSDDLDKSDSKEAENYSRHLRLSRELLDTERRTALRLRDEGRISDEDLREMEREMDLTDTRLVAAMDRQTEKIRG